MSTAPPIRTTAAELPEPSIPDTTIDGGLGYDDIFGQTDASAADKDKVVEVFVPAINFAPLADGLYDVFARVTNALGFPVTSAPLSIRLKLAVPGGMDPVADTPYCNENLAAPVVEPLVIAPDTDSATVTIAPWQNKAAGDRLTLRWGMDGNELEHTVPAGEESRPYTFPVDRAVIDAGGFGVGVNVNYEVDDLVGNWSLWSPPTLVETEHPDALDPPWVTPTVDDAGKVIDLAELGTGDITAKVFSLQQGDIVTVHLDGITAEGSPVEHTTEPKVATADGQVLSFTLPNALFPPLAQGTCAIGYTLERQGDTYTSARRRLEIHGQLTALAPPSVAEAVGDTLDPEAVPNGATVWVEANPLIAAGSRVNLEMYGTTTGGMPVGDKQFRDIVSDTRFPLPFTVEAGKIAALAGSTATFAYTVETFDARSGRRVRHMIRPSALYPSPERTYQIIGGRAPVIVIIRDSIGEVPDGGTTIDTTITISGVAAANKIVDLFDGSTLVGTAPVNDSGQWARQLAELALGGHTFKARGSYDSKPESAIRTLTVLRP